MNKIILNTALKTVAAVLAVFILTFSALTIFAPKTLAELNKKMGNNTLAASFLIIEYNRNKDVNDLSDIIELSILEARFSRILKYSEILINHSKFEDFCKFKDKKTNSNIYAGYKQFIYGWNVTALYNEEDKEKALERAINAIPPDYCKNNVMQYLIIATINNKDKAFSEEILIVLQQIYSDIGAAGLGGEEQEQIAARLMTDITAIQNFLADNY